MLQSESIVVSSVSPWQIPLAACWLLDVGDVTSKAKAALRVYCLDRLCGQAQRQVCSVHSVLQMSEVE